MCASEVAAQLRGRGSESERAALLQPRRMTLKSIGDRAGATNWRHEMATPKMKKIPEMKKIPDSRVAPRIWNLESEVENLEFGFDLLLLQGRPRVGVLDAEASGVVGNVGTTFEQKRGLT